MTRRATFIRNSYLGGTGAAGGPSVIKPRTLGEEAQCVSYP